MPRSALVRHSIGAVAAVTLAAGIGPLGHTATAADGGSVVFPAATAAQPRTVVPLSAGPGGYLRYEQGQGQFWTTWDGETIPVRNDAEGPETGGVYGAGSDIVAALDFDGPSIYGDVRLWDVTAGTNRYLTIPDRHRYIGTFGDKVVTYTRSSTDASNEWHVLRLVNGSVQDTLVTGWPEGSTRAARAAAGDADGALTRYTLNGVSRPVWIDLSSARARTVPTDVTANGVGFVHTPTDVVEWTDDGKIRFYAKGAAGSSGPLPLTSTTDLPYDDGDVLLGVVGTRLIVGRATGQGGSAPYRVVSVPRAGGEETTLFAYGRNTALAAPDGGLLIVAGSSAGDLGLQRIRPDGVGTTGAELVDVTPLTSKPRHLSFSHGQLESLERMPDESNAFRSRTVSVTGALSAGATKERGDLGVPLAGCTDESACPRPFATGDGRTVINPDPGPGMGKVPVVVEAGATTGRPLTTELASFQTTDVSGRYAVGLAAIEEYGSPTTTSVDLDTGKRLADFDAFGGPWNVDLYGDTLWAAGKVNGTVVGYDVRTGAVKRTVDLKSGCRAESLKVTAHWLSWNCAGLPVKGGVFDLDTNTNRTYTQPFSELGDGYVVHGDGSEVTVTDIRGTEPVVKGTHRLSEFNDETGPYAVDTATGRLAYQDNAAGDVRVVDLGVPASPPARIDADVPAAQAVNGGAVSWKPRWWLSKPAASWTLTLRNKTTGAVARTLSGDEARGVLQGSWDGKDAAGKLVANGTYTWALTAKPADGQGADLSLTGSVAISGAAPVFRDLVGNDGFGELLVKDSTGLVSLYKGTGTGGVSSRVAGSGKFAVDAHLVPFGDVNGDRCNDVLVRQASELRVYRPGCGKVVSPSSPYTVIGSGWSQYDVLTSPGDINGDGYQDVIARQTTTGDMYFYAGTADHRFKGRVKIGTNWKTYAKITGAGDLNGDGRGDLLGVDKAGVLWRYYGTATGGVTTRVKLASGWGAYTSVVGIGDVTGDGKPDVVARTSDGKLFRFSGTGNGTLAARVQIGNSGWAAFKGLY
ncbi:FG-GAP-like repeat-containing protein [Streptomyces sp. NPDC002867]